MKRIIILLAVLSTAVYQSGAQNLDPTVEVTRGYKAELTDVQKSIIDMAVSDTVYRFDLNFDYSVFDNPYRGSYEFYPYTMDMKPQNPPYKPSTLYVNAGVGYTLHPVLDVYYSPALDGALGVDLMGKHRSYFGGYRAPSVGGSQAGVAFNKGYDMASRVGMDLGYDWKKTAVDFGLAYYGVAVKDCFHQDAYNAMDVSLSFKSKSHWSKGFMYNVSAVYRLGGSKLVREHVLGLDAKFGPRLRSRHKVFVDLGAKVATYGKQMSSTFGSGYVLPHYVYKKNRFKADLGARLSFVASNNSAFPTKNQFVYPDLHISYALIRNAMRFYVNVTGGEKINTYSSILDKNHHFNALYQYGANPLLGASLERVRPELGFEGRITHFFTYELKGGYSLMANAPMDVLVRQSDGLYRPGLGYTDFQQAYLGFRFGCHDSVCSGIRRIFVNERDNDIVKLNQSASLFGIRHIL